jgi:outer membrane receptor protein involved in Fe transport
MKWISLLLLANIVVAQEGPRPLGYIKGIVMDEKTKTPIEYASVGLLKAQDSSVVEGVITSTTGEFILTNIRPGKYFVKINGAGFKKYNSNIIAIFPPNNLNIELNKITLTSVATDLKEVTIESDKGFKASQIDKRVYNPTQLMSAISGSASDLLSNIPSLNMNQDNQMSFRGNDNVTILVDGKPSSLTNASLSQIPALSIESIEVITNPSAKFNPEGTAGIINIIMKKNKSKINSGTITAGVSSKNKYQFDLAYNYQFDKINIYANYGYKYDERYNYGYTSRNYLSQNGINHFYQNTDGMKYQNSHLSRLNVEYLIDPKTTIQVGGNITYSPKNEFNWKTNTDRDSSNTLRKEWSRYIDENNVGISYDVSMSFRKEYKSPKHYLIIDAIRNYNQNIVNNTMEENYFVPFKWNKPFSIYNNQERNTNNIKIDFAQPLKNDYYIELGFNSQWRDFNFLTDSKKYYPIYNELRTDSAYSNNFRYLDDIYSVYGILSKNIKKANIKAGLRLEQTNTRLDNYNHENYTRFNYFAAFPSLSMNYEIDDKQSVMISYSRRINRPGPGQLNTIQDILDPTSLRLGNPTMRPEYINSYELGYGKAFKNKISWNNNVYYKLSYDAMTRFVTVDSNGTGIVQVQNLGNNMNTGWESILNMNSIKWLSILFSSNLSKNELSYSTPTKTYSNGNIVWQGRLNANFKLPKDFDFMVVGFYRSPSVTPQGLFSYHASVDLTLRKKVLKQRGVITLTCSDIFDTMRFYIEVNDANFQAASLRKSETRVANLSFRYNFGVESKKVKQVKPVEIRPSGDEF